MQPRIMHSFIDAEYVIVHILIISGLLYGESIKLACNLTIQHLDVDHLKGTRLNNGQ